MKKRPFPVGKRGGEWLYAAMNTGSQPSSHSHPATPFTAESTGDNRLERTATEALGYIAGVLAGIGRMLLTSKLVAYLLINAGVFFGAVALLPHAPQYSYSGPVSQFINSRYHWDTAGLATLASCCITAGVMIFFSRKKNP